MTGAAAMLGGVARADTPPLELTLRAGPVVWKEEFWALKPDMLEPFLAAYREQVYALARKTPGYRGYTVMASPTPPASGPLAANAPLITPHYGIHLDGAVFTGRSLNVGALLSRTHNLVIAHHFQTWADADRFEPAFARAYAARHGGVSAADGLAKALFPMTTNFWETYLRLVSTGYGAGPVARGADADGLDLTPRAAGARVVKEYWDIAPDQYDAFLASYTRDSYPTTSRVKGHRGLSIVTRLPPKAGEARLTAHARAAFPLGGPDAFITPHEGGVLDGTIRTDRSVNFGVMFKPTYSLITYHHMAAGGDPLSGKVMQEIYGPRHGGTDREAFITKTMFPHARNHWDMSYAVVESSFTTNAPHGA